MDKSHDFQLLSVPFWLCFLLGRKAEAEYHPGLLRTFCYFIKKRLEEAGFPVLAFHADPVNPRKWNAESMTNLVDEFIETRVIPSKEAKSKG